MNRNEVKLWTNYHLSLFPDFRAWWQSQEKSARAIIYAGYCKALARADLIDCQAVSDGILAGTIKRPWNHQDTLAAVMAGLRGIWGSRQPQAKTIEGQETAVCPNCHDSGWVEREYPESAERFGGGQKYYSTVCGCPRGASHSGRPWGSPQAVPVF